MALNLAIHKATVTDDGGTVTATQANMNGIHDEDESTNVLEIATNNTLYLHYDLGAAYQISQLRIYASIIDVAYWVVQCSNNDVDWTTESLATTGSYVYSNIDDGYRYLRIRCDTTGRSAISLREYEIDADATLMKYQAGASDQIGATDFTGINIYPMLNYYIVIDTEHPAPADGYLVALKGLHSTSSTCRDRYRIMIFRSVDSSWTVIKVQGISGISSWTTADPIILDPPIKFKAGDMLAIRGCAEGVNFGWLRIQTVVGGEYYSKSTAAIPGEGDTIPKSGYSQVSGERLKFVSCSYADLGIGSLSVPIPDRFLTGLPGVSTDPRVVNIDSVEGLTPEIDFYSVVSSLAAGIGSGDTSLTLHNAAGFPQAAAGAVYGGRLQIGTEKIDYTYISGGTVNGLARGVDGSSPAAHSMWDIVKDITKWVEISVDDATWKKSGDAGLPLSLGATIVAGTHKAFYIRANIAYEYQDDKQIYSRVHVLWSV